MTHHALYLAGSRSTLRGDSFLIVAELYMILRDYKSMFCFWFLTSQITMLRNKGDVVRDGIGGKLTHLFLALLRRCVWYGENRAVSRPQTIIIIIVFFKEAPSAYLTEGDQYGMSFIRFDDLLGGVDEERASVYHLFKFSILKTNCTCHRFSP